MTDKILIVDDEPDTINLAKMILERKGYHVVSAFTGDEAIQKAESEMPDFIYLDMVMPGKSGLEVCKILKAQSKTKKIPLVMFTALGRDVDKKLSKEAGADGHFLKPFTAEDLIDEIKGPSEYVDGADTVLLLTRPRQSKDKKGQFTGYQADKALYQIKVRNAPVNLTPLNLRFRDDIFTFEPLIDEDEYA